MKKNWLSLLFLISGMVIFVGICIAFIEYDEDSLNFVTLVSGLATPIILFIASALFWKNDKNN